MKVCGPLPEVMMPYAERMFTWFPEVLVALGHPTLQEMFVLPPHPGVQMTLEETSAYKLVQVKLRRCSKRRNVLAGARDRESSPFSKSRANAPAHAAARASAAVRSGELKEEPHFFQKSVQHPGRSPIGANHPSSREGDAATGRDSAAGARHRGSDRATHADSHTHVGPSEGPSQSLVAAAGGGGKNNASVVAATARVQESSPSRLSTRERPTGYPLRGDGAVEVLEDAPASTTPASITPAGAAARTPEGSVEQSCQRGQLPERPAAPVAYLSTERSVGESPQVMQDGVAGGSASTSGVAPGVLDNALQPNLRRSATAPSGHPSPHLRCSSDTPVSTGGEVKPLRPRAESAFVQGSTSQGPPSGTETLISAAAPARWKSGTRVMSRGDADPHSPKLSSPGSHNPWNEPMPFLQLLAMPMTNPIQDEQPTLSRKTTPVDALPSVGETATLVDLPKEGVEEAMDVSNSAAIEQSRRDGLPPLPPMAEMPALPAPSRSESVAVPMPGRAMDSGQFSTNTTTGESPPPGHWPKVRSAMDSGQLSTNTTMKSPPPEHCEKPPLPPDGLRTPVMEHLGQIFPAAPLTPGSMASSFGSSSESRADAPSRTADPQAVPASPGGAGTPPGCAGRCPSSVPLRHRRGLELQMPTHVRTFKKEKDSLAKDANRHSSGDSTDGGSHSNQVCPPAIISQSLLNAKGIKMPGAFPHHRTVFFFDWDDTLCPTTWIRDTLKLEMADSLSWAMSAKEFEEDWRYSIPSWFGQPLPDIPQIHDKIWALQRSVIDVIKTAQSLGVVCIVTNACEGWVEKTTKKWLPHLTEYVFGHGSRPAIQVLYGQIEYKATKQDKADESLDFVDSLHELKLWKKSAMQAALEHVDDLYRVRPRCNDRSPSEVSQSMMKSESTMTTKRPSFHRSHSGLSSGSDKKSSAFTWSGSAVTDFSASSGLSSHTGGDLIQVPWVTNGSRSNDLVNILSIGDSEAEMQGAELAASVYREALRQPPGSSKRAQSAPAALRSPGRPWVKQVKLWDGPSLDQIVEQLDFLTKSLPQVVAARSHLRLEPEHLRTWAAPLAATFGCGRGGGQLAVVEDAEMHVQRLLRTQSI